MKVPIKTIIKDLDLKLINHVTKDYFVIENMDLNRPGLQFANFFDYFAFIRVQVVGRVEMTYIKGKDKAYRREIMDKFFSSKIPCVIVARGLRPVPEMIEYANKYDVPVFSAKVTTTNLSLKLVDFLGKQLAPTATIHGVLLDVYGAGVLITGDSGIGKSETALELIKRGHMLVADDVVEITRVADNRIVGQSPELVRHMMEIRGIGLIDIRYLYGVGAVIRSKSIDLVMEMETWDETKMYDRLGIVDEYTTLLETQIPKLTMPVRPGRNTAIVVEVAARNFWLKKMGYNAAMEFDKRLTAKIRENRSSRASDRFLDD